MKDYVLLDVGGTNIKMNIYRDNGKFYFSNSKFFPSRAHEPASLILNNLSTIVTSAVEQVKQLKDDLLGVGLAFPGPFDYEQGISYIKSLNKYDSLYGINIREHLRRILNELGETQAILKFSNDATAFGVGEFQLSDKAVHRGISIALGTGCGSCFVMDGQCVKPAIAGVNNEGMIYEAPYRSSIIDDYLSARGLQNIISGHQFGQPITTGFELARLAQQNNTEALSTFQEFGNVIDSALIPFVQAFQADELVFGGEISRSLPFFLTGLTELRKTNLKIRATSNTSISTMIGLVNMMIPSLNFQGEVDNGGI